MEVNLFDEIKASLDEMSLLQDKEKAHTKELMDKITECENGFSTAFSGYECQINDINNKVKRLKHDIAVNSTHFEYFFWNGYRKDGEGLIETKKRFFRNLTCDENTRLIHKALAILLEKIVSVCKNNDIEVWLEKNSLLGFIRHEGIIPWETGIALGIMRKDAAKLIELIKAEKESMRISNYYAYRTQFCNICRVSFADSEIPHFIDIFFYDYCARDIQAIKQKYTSLRKNVNAEFKAFMPHIEKVVPNRDLVRQYQIKDEHAVQEITERWTVLRREAGFTADIGDRANTSICWGADNYTLPQYQQCAFDCSDFFPLRKIEFEGVECHVPSNFGKVAARSFGDVYKLPDNLEIMHKTTLNDKLKIALEKFINENAIAGM